MGDYRRPWTNNLDILRSYRLPNLGLNKGYCAVVMYWYEVVRDVTCISPVEQKKKKKKKKKK
jgi:hypothetical protein